MSRRCLYCAKELPKTATNNFCSKDCWTEYKKLKAMDIGTDRQATVLLKRSELIESENLAIDSDPEPDFELSGQSSDTESILSYDHHLGQDVFEDTTQQAPAKSSLVEPEQPIVSSKKLETLAMRLAAIENLLSGKSTVSSTDADEPLVKQIENLAIRQNKLEVDLEKVDFFLRSADKFEDRIRRLERRMEGDPLLEPVKKRGFFARLFS